MLKFEPRDGTSPNGKPWVFLCALPEEVQAQLDLVREDIFEFCNCTIWYDDGVDTSPSDLEDAIAQSAMAVLPVTAALLDPNSAIQRHILPLLQAHRVSILPIVDNPNLLDIFNARFKNIQALDRHNNDRTAIAYEEKLKRFLDTMLLKDDLADRVSQAFSNQLFLSYRKKDRAIALDLMKQLHKDPRCRSISLWYDEFLTPGEEFNKNIVEAIVDCDLFLLALTQNMVNEDNYVIREEYPCARTAGKDILPAVLENIDYNQVQQCFPEIPPLIDSTKVAQYVSQHIGDTPEATPEQDYLLGLAFLHGFHVERQVGVGLEQLERSAQRGYAPAALQLASIQILEQNPEEQKSHKLKWLRKYAALAYDEYAQTPCTETAKQYADALDRAAEAEFQQHPGAAFELYEQAIDVLEKYGCRADCAQVCSNYGLQLVAAGKNQDGLKVLMKATQQYADQYKADPEWGKNHAEQFSYCYYNTGYAAVQAGETKWAEIAYDAAIRNFTVLARENPREYTLVLAQSYGNLGAIYGRKWASTGDEELYEKAVGYHSKAIDILNSAVEWAPEVYEPTLARECVLLASVYLQKPEHDKAKQALSLAIDILSAYEDLYPGQHTDALASALGNRAVLFLAQDRIEDARKDFDTAIGIFRRTPGRQMELAKALWNMANTYAAQKAFGTAQQYLEEAISIYESGTVQGAQRSPDYAQCCYNFAVVLCEGKHYQQALSWANRATDVYRALQRESEAAYAARLEDLRNFAQWLESMI